MSRRTSPSLINADTHQLEMAVLNLCLNARDAMPNGGTIAIRLASATITSGHRSKLLSANYLYLSIEDTGSGLTQESRARLFEPYFSTKSSGTGLGLAIVRRVVLGHGGSIDVRSAPDRGTTVRTPLPETSLCSAAARRRRRRRSRYRAAGNARGSRAGWPHRASIRWDCSAS